MNRKVLFFLIGLVFFALGPLGLYAAEIMQVTDSSTLLIGDQNRTYTVKIACLEVDPSKEDSIINFLKSDLPRHSRVNLKPKGSEQGVLISKVILLGTNDDIGSKIVSKGWAKSAC